MSDSLNAMVADFQKAGRRSTAAARETQAKGIQAKEAEYQRRTQELEQKAQARQNELVQPIIDKIKKVIEEIRAEDGYAIIFNADQGSPIVAADKNLDITDRVLAQAEGARRPPAPRPSAVAARARPA